MSQQLIFKCANIGCQNNVFRKYSNQSKKRFCRVCLILDATGTILRWKCTGCDHIISDQNVRKRTCDKCKVKRKNEYMKNYHLGTKIIKKIRRMKDKRCHSCGGLFSGMGVFCTDYCRWITRMEQQHYKIILRLEDLKCG